MKKNQHLIAFLVTIVLFSLTANAQSIVDPGISVHNYKHPNKAAQAKANGKEIKTVRVESYRTIEQFGKYQRSRYASNTPKYAPRPARLVVVREYKIDGVDINPLLSPRNYKTPAINISKDTSELADYYNKSDKSIYPTTD